MSRRLLAGTVLVGLGILVTVFGLTDSKPVYARSVSAFLAQPLYDRTVRVEGTLVHGSLCRVATPCEYRFRLQDRFRAMASAAATAPAWQELSVRYPACIAPDTFREMPGIDLNVTVEGELCAKCHQFEASAIMAKGPGKYLLSTDGGPSPVLGLPLPACATP